MADNHIFCNWFSPMSAVAHHEAIPPTPICLHSPSPSADINHCDVDNPSLSLSSIVIVPPAIVHRHHLPRQLPLPFTTIHRDHIAGNCPPSSSANISHHCHRPYLWLLGPHPPNKGSSASSQATEHMFHHLFPTHCGRRKRNDRHPLAIRWKQTKMALHV